MRVVDKLKSKGTKSELVVIIKINKTGKNHGICKIYDYKPHQT